MAIPLIPVAISAVTSGATYLTGAIVNGAKSMLPLMFSFVMARARIFIISTFVLTILNLTTSLILFVTYTINATFYGWLSSYISVLTLSIIVISMQGLCIALLMKLTLYFLKNNKGT